MTLTGTDRVQAELLWLQRVELQTQRVKVWNCILKLGQARVATYVFLVVLTPVCNLLTT